MQRAAIERNGAERRWFSAPVFRCRCRRRLVRRMGAAPLPCAGFEAAWQRIAAFGAWLRV